MTNPNSHVKFGSTKKHEKILTGISWKMCLRGMNNYWNHEPEIFWYKKKVRKSQEFFDSEVRPPPRVDFWKKFLTSFFYGPLWNHCHFFFFEGGYQPPSETKSFFDIPWWVLHFLTWYLGGKGLEIDTYKPPKFIWSYHTHMVNACWPKWPRAPKLTFLSNFYVKNSIKSS